MRTSTIRRYYCCFGCWFQSVHILTGIEFQRAWIPDDSRLTDASWVEKSIGLALTVTKTGMTVFRTNRRGAVRTRPLALAHAFSPKNKMRSKWSRELIDLARYTALQQDLIQPFCVKSQRWLSVSSHPLTCLSSTCHDHCCSLEGMESQNTRHESHPSQSWCRCTAVWASGNETVGVLIYNSVWS